MITKILRSTSQFAQNNSPAILTSVAVAGTITTGILAAQGGMKAHRILLDEKIRISLERTGQEENEFDVDLKTAAKLTAKCYVPAGLTAAGTIAAVIMLNRVGTRRTAAMAAAWAMSERTFTEYKDKVIETIGETKEQRIQDDVVQDRFTKAVENREIVVVGDGRQLCFDMWSGRQFESSYEDIKAAVNRVNYMINNEGYASLTDFYNAIGLPPVAYSDEFGWNTDKLLDVQLTTVLTPDKKPAIGLNFRVVPTKDYQRFH